MSEAIDSQVDSSTSDVNHGTEASTAPKQVPVENRVAELNRKLNGLSGKIDQLISSLHKPSAENASAVHDAAPGDPVSQLREEIMVDKHRDSFKKATDIFPELDQKSETYDEDFFREVDSMYRQLSAIKDPDAPFKAAKLVALERGKFEQLEREKLFADESRRSRILSEGGAAPKQNTKPKESVPENLKALAQLLGTNQDKLKDHIKANAKRYKLGE
jgi:hypothetical protein